MKNLQVSDIQYEMIENMISYYDHIKVEKLIDEHPGFVCADLNTLLNILSIAAEEA